VIAVVGGVLVVVLVIAGIASAAMKRKTPVIASAPKAAGTASADAPATTLAPPEPTSGTATASAEPAGSLPPTVPASEIRTIPAPIPALTPGAVFAQVTRVQVCVPGYAASVRHVSPAEKMQVFARYHAHDAPRTYEVDHLIALELGGSNEITNLWPEPLTGPYGALVKDKVENSLHDAVCTGTITLADAQRVSAAAWWSWLPRIGLGASASLEPPSPRPPSAP
jgi:hypothetical protein